MPEYNVVKGDTVWALSRKALEEQLGRRPTNREVLEIVGQVQVPSGDVNLIYPGEKITIPVGPGYGQRPGDEGFPDDPSVGGSRPQRPGTMAGGQDPQNDPRTTYQRPPSAFLPGGQDPQNDPSLTWRFNDPVEEAAARQFVNSAGVTIPLDQYGRPQANPLSGTGWEAYHQGPTLGIDTPREVYGMGGLVAGALAGGIGGAALRGLGAGAGRGSQVLYWGDDMLPAGRSAAAGGRPAIGAGPARPALGTGGGPGPAVGAGRQPIPLGPGGGPVGRTPIPANGPVRTPFPSEASLRPNVIPQYPWGSGFQRYGTGYMG